MSKLADANGSKRARPESELKADTPVPAGGFAAVPAQRLGTLQPDVKVVPFPTGGETALYQVPLELLVLARNKEKDKARSVAVTPVAPRPNSDEPPPSSELSDLRVEQAAEPVGAAAATHSTEPPAAPVPDRSGGAPSDAVQKELAGSAPPVDTEGKFGGPLAWLLVVALGLAAGCFVVELLRWY